MTAFAEFLERWFRETNSTPARLSEITGIQPSIISRWLSSKRPMRPGPKNLEKLAPVVGSTTEDLMRLCGYLPGEAQQASRPDELDARMERLKAILRPYPRAFWVSILDANELMAEGMADALQSGEPAPNSPQPAAAQEAPAPQPASNPPVKPASNPQKSRVKRGTHAADEGLTPNYTQSPVLVGAGSRG